jgi:hypothetical protein
MPAAALARIYIIPMLYVVFQWLRETVRAKWRHAPLPEPPPART